MKRIPRVHTLKLSDKFLCNYICDCKEFSKTMYNDKDYHVGDFIKFISIDESDNKVHHLINSYIYRITNIANNIDGYILEDNQYLYSMRKVDL